MHLLYFIWFVFFGSKKERIKDSPKNTMAVYIHGRFISIGQTPSGRFLYNKNVFKSAYNPIAAPAISEMLLRNERVFCNPVIFEFSK